MINRYSQRRVYNQFNPLSMQELSALPGLKQQQHEQAIVAAESLNTQGQVLSKDKELFEKGANDINQNITKIVDDLTQSGIQSDTFSDILSLKRKKEDFLNPNSGFGGKALNNYALYQKALKDIDDMRKSGKYLNSDLENSLALAMKHYQGVEAGDVFNYTNPARYIDMQDKVLDVLSKIPASKIEKDLGLTPMGFDPQTGHTLYKHGSKIIEERSFEHQNLIAQRYLYDDPEVIAYLSDQATFAEELYSTIENQNGVLKRNYNGKYYDVDSFRNEFIKSRIESVAATAAEATNFKNVTGSTDYKFVKMSDAFIKAWENANSQSNLSTREGTIGKNQRIGDVDYDVYTDASGKKHKYVYQFESRTALDPNSVEKGKVPPNLSYSEFKKYMQVTNGTVGTFLDYTRYNLGVLGKKESFRSDQYDDGKFGRTGSRNVEIDYEVDYKPIAQSVPQNSDQFVKLWRDKMPKEEQDKYTDDEIAQIYNDLKVTSFASKGYHVPGQGIDRDLRNIYSKVSKYMGLKRKLLSTEEAFAINYLSNDMLSQAYSSAKQLNPDLTYENFISVHKENLKSKGNVATLTTDLNLESQSQIIKSFSEGNTAALLNLDFTLVEEKDGQSNIISTAGTEGTNFLKGLTENGGEYEVTAASRVIYSFDDTKVGGHSMKIKHTDKDGNVKFYSIQTQPLSMEEAAMYYPLQKANESWLNSTKVQKPSEVSENNNNLLYNSEIVLSEFKDGLWYDSNMKPVTQVNNLIIAGVLKAEDLQPKMKISSNLHAFNTYAKDPNGNLIIQERGIEKLYKYNEKNELVPLIDPRLYDKTLEDSDELTIDQQSAIRSLMFTPLETQNLLIDRYNVDYYNRGLYSSANESKKINPGY